jgi:hypothetical protein
VPRHECAHATDSGSLVATMPTIVAYVLRYDGYLWDYYKDGRYIGRSVPGVHHSLSRFTPQQSLVTRLSGKGFAQRYTLEY